jgi:hypothetical protein
MSACGFSAVMTLVCSRLDQWHGQRHDLADPRSHEGAIEIDLFTRVDAGLPIERLMIEYLLTRMWARGPAPGRPPPGRRWRLHRIADSRYLSSGRSLKCRGRRQKRLLRCLGPERGSIQAVARAAATTKATGGRHCSFCALSGYSPHRAGSGGVISCRPRFTTTAHSMPSWRSAKRSWRTPRMHIQSA